MSDCVKSEQNNSDKVLPSVKAERLITLMSRVLRDFSCYDTLYTQN
jgi:hypothetical protein